MPLRRLMVSFTSRNLRGKKEFFMRFARWTFSPGALLTFQLTGRNGENSGGLPQTPFLYVPDNEIPYEQADHFKREFHFSGLH